MMMRIILVKILATQESWCMGKSIRICLDKKGGLSEAFKLKRFVDELIRFDKTAL
jgi:hypothetical protein